MPRIIRKVVPLPKLEQPKRVAAYVRVSSGKDAMLHSLSAQISAYSRMIQQHEGWQYIGVYADVDAPYGQNVKARECLILSALTGSSFFN